MNLLHITLAALAVSVVIILGACSGGSSAGSPTVGQEKSATMPGSFAVNKTEEDWKKILTPEQFATLREKDTERPFTGKYDDFYQKGTYVCAACGAELFTSDTKFDAGCGWPSFFAAKAGNKVLLVPDTSLGMNRTEVLCANCGGHLGHLFDDGPAPTGQRFCINSVSLKFIPAKDAATMPAEKK